MKLPEAQEEALVAWIRDIGALGYPRTYAFAKSIAEAITGVQVGSHWISRFFKRHKGPQGIATRRESRIHQQLLKVAHPDAINTFLDALEHAIEEKRVDLL